MAVRIIRENNRSAGKKPKNGVDIIAGQPVVLDTADTLKPYDSDSIKVYGIAAESTEQLPIAPSSGLTAGEGFNYTDFARGGLVSTFQNGSVLELFDDGRGAPYETNDTYALNVAVHAKANGLLSVDTTSGQEVGSVVDFEGSPVTRLRVKFDV